MRACAGTASGSGSGRAHPRFFSQNHGGFHGGQGAVPLVRGGLVPVLAEGAALRWLGAFGDAGALALPRR